MIAFDNGKFSPSNGDKSDYEFMRFLTNLIDYETKEVVPSRTIVMEEIEHVHETGKQHRIHEVY